MRIDILIGELCSPYGYTLELPMVELPARAVVLPHVGLGADPGGQEAGAVLLALPVQRVPLLGLQGHRHTARHNHHLGTGNGQK